LGVNHILIEQDYPHYRRQDGERDEAESRRYLQCPVKHDFQIFPCESMRHVAMCSYKESWEIQPSTPLKILPTVEEREERY